MLIVVMASQVHTYGKTDQTVLFKYVQFAACQVCLTKAIKITPADTEKNGDGSCRGSRKTTS